MSSDSYGSLPWFFGNCRLSFFSCRGLVQHCYCSIHKHHTRNTFPILDIIGLRYKFRNSSVKDHRRILTPFITDMDVSFPSESEVIVVPHEEGAATVEYEPISPAPAEPVAEGDGLPAPPPSKRPRVHFDTDVARTLARIEAKLDNIRGENKKRHVDLLEKLDMCAGDVNQYTKTVASALLKNMRRCEAAVEELKARGGEVSTPLLQAIATLTTEANRMLSRFEVPKTP